jgi:hypothetical protein
MRKKPFLLICLSALLSYFIIIILYSYSKRISTAKNSFIRFFPPHILTNFNYVDIRYNSYYIAGVSSQQIYLGNYMAASNLVMFDQNLKDSQLILLNVPERKEIAWPVARVMVDSPDIYLGEGRSPVILYTKLPSIEMKSILKPDSIHFDNVWLAISPTAIILRRYSPETKQNVLSKKTSGFPLLTKESGTLEKQLDGKFCTDGILLYDHNKTDLVYVYNYRNQFIILDTNLNIKHKYKTIDTTSLVKISLDTIYSENRVTFSAPPEIVNKRACISNNRLFVNSGLMANNEDSKSFTNSSDIDIYDLDNGSYIYSFSIPHFRNEKVRYMKSLGNRIILLFDTYLATYDLNF